jgi:hypothetical protein
VNCAGRCRTRKCSTDEDFPPRGRQRGQPTESVAKECGGRPDSAEMDAIDLPGQVPNWHVRFGSHSTKVLPLTKEWTICGRHPACDVVFDNNAVGRRHFAVVLRRGGCYVHDLNSRCGTMLHRGTGVGGLRADCEIRPGCWQVVGLTPLRAGDEFGHPAGWLTLEQAVPMSTDDWVTGNNSQSMLLREGTFWKTSTRGIMLR